MQTKLLEKLKSAKSVDDKEKIVQAFWQENKIFEKTVETPASAGSYGEAKPASSFSFYDGPPFATGLPHFGHILAGTIKDAIPRFQTMNGKSVRRKWGWDCHGLPIENLIEKKLSLNSKKEIEEYGIANFNKEAYESVLTYEKEWNEIVPRLGRFVDMNHNYKTMDATYTESVWWAWKELYDKGLAYEGSKLMHICPRCETTLAQSEVGMNYEDVTDISVTAKFELIDEPNTFVLAWTTTPWTLPGNVALAINKDIEYVKVEVVSSTEQAVSRFILSKERMKDVLKDKEYKIVDEFKGEKLVGKSYKPVFNYFADKELENKNNIYKIWSADFVTTDTGTGVVHIAPAFGEDDMNLAKANNLPIIKHVKMNGEFTNDVIDFAGMKVKKVGDTQSADIEIIKWLAHNGKLFAKEKLIHSYPLCWRCKTPLLNYATSSWFIDVPQMKEKLLSENQKINFVPAHIRDGRFGKWLEGAHEWAVSRTRYWGAPLPVFKCKDCDAVKVIGSLKELSEAKKPKNNYFVMRHGQANGNVDHILDSYGDPNNNLTDEGKKQASNSAKLLKNENINIILSSPIPRAQETAKIVAGELNLSIETENRLREFELGIFNGKSYNEYLASGLSFDDLDKKLEGGESHRDVMNRVMALIASLEEKYEGKNILLVTHGSPSFMLSSCSSLKTDEEIMSQMKEDNTDTFLKNGTFEKLILKIVPRNGDGQINLHRPNIDDFKFACSCGSEMKIIGDVFDCWFESGAMPFASVHYPFENKEIFLKNNPAEFIAEGLDQTRGWFYSLLNLGVGLFGKSPYKNVIVNGMVMAGDGKKMSKSEKNYTDPMILVEKYGADALRYSLLSSPLVKGEIVSFSDENVDEVYKKIILRMDNVVSLYEMNKDANVEAKNNSQNILDRWIISRLNEVINSSTKGYSNYLLDDAVRPVEQFVDDLSVWFVRRSRARLKGDPTSPKGSDGAREGEKEKKFALGTLKFALTEFAKVIAPAMPFMAERIYKVVDGEKESVHLEKWPVGGEVSEEIIKNMKETREIVSQALMERTKNKINVRQPLAKLFVRTDLANEYLEIIKDEINVKEVKVVSRTQEVGSINTISLDINLTPELIREGELRNLMRAVQDVRKEKGLSVKDLVTLNISIDENYFGATFNEQLKSTCNVKEVNWNGCELKEGEKISFEIIS